MKKIFLVGKFNEIFEDISKYLSQYFSIQVCVDKPDMVNGMLKLNRPDVIIISMIDMNLEHVKIFADIKKNYSDIPVVGMGTAKEQSYFEAFLAEKQFHILTRPVSNEIIAAKIAEILSLQFDEEKNIYVDFQEKRKCIMIVDDNAAQLRMLQEMIKDKYDVQMATSGMKALTLLGKRVPDLIFLDYEMPLCDGKMTLQMIREVEEARDIPVVFLTGMREKEHIKAALELKAAGYLLKPASADTIFDAISKFMK